MAIAEDDSNMFHVRVTYVEIYREIVTDLLQSLVGRKAGSFREEGENDGYGSPGVHSDFALSSRQGSMGGSKGKAKSKETQLVVREDKFRGPYVDGAVEMPVGSPDEALEMLRLGERNRHFAATRMNTRSSRSHVIFTVTVESMQLPSGATGVVVAGDNGGMGMVAGASTLSSGAKARRGRRGSMLATLGKEETGDLLSPGAKEVLKAAAKGTGAGGAMRAVSVSCLNLVDLAGSERVSKTGATGERLDEARSINASLFVLGRIIKELSI